MKLDLQKLQGLVKTYGARLYEQVDHIGTVTDGVDARLDGDTLWIPDGIGGELPVGLRRSAEPTAGGTFEIHAYEAQRDAEFEYNGEITTVSKGHVKPFAVNA